jgi:hypothetical protein
MPGVYPGYMRRLILASSLIVLLSPLACGKATPAGDSEPPPIDEPSQPATASRLPIPPTPDLAIVHTATGVEVLDTAGKRLATLVPHPVSWCRIDPRAEVLWFRHGGEGKLAYLDLRSTDPATTLLAGSPDTIVIDYGDESLGRPGSHEFNDGLVLHMQIPPRVEALQGCEGDMIYSCFPGDELESETVDIDAILAKRLAQLTKDIEARPILAPDKLAALVTRSTGRRATFPEPQGSPEPTAVASVPKTKCYEMPEACGEARRLLGTPYWLVLVGNDRGDFYHETVQLHDPATHEFFDPLDPTRRSTTPFEEDDPFMPSWVSPSGTMLSDDSRLVKLGVGVVAKDLEGSCGFWGGGWEPAILE